MAKRHCIRYGRRSDGSKTCREFAPGAWRPGLGDLGAVARHGGGYGRRSRDRTLRICVTVGRDIGASRANQYDASAEPCAKSRVTFLPGRKGGRYGHGRGRTPTAAVKKALRALAAVLR